MYVAMCTTVFLRLKLRFEIGNHVCLGNFMNMQVLYKTKQPIRTCISLGPGPVDCSSVYPGFGFSFSFGYIGSCGGGLVTPHY